MFDVVALILRLTYGSVVAKPDDTTFRNWLVLDLVSPRLNLTAIMTLTTWTFIFFFHSHTLFI